MAYKLHQHAVITGSLNSFCLACESFFRTDKETTVHIEKPLHQKNLAMTPYFEKLKGDGIRKVKMGYYCEYCNTLLPIASKVTLHVAESSHVNNRGALSLRPTGLDVIAFDNVLIQEEVWHGLTEESVCLVCNTEFEDEDLHKSSLAHGLNLVQKRVEFSLNKGIYRLVDGTTTQCLTCHVVFSPNMMADHFKSSDHQNLYEKCRKENIDIISQSEKPGDVLASPERNETETNKKPIEILVGNALAKINGNTNETRGDEPKVIGTNNNKTSEKLPSDDAASFAESNKITYNANNSDAYCRMCEKRLPSNLQSMKEHVGGGPHMKNLTKVNAMPKFTKKTMINFVKSVIDFQAQFLDEIIVNEKYCLTIFSFQMIREIESGLRCLMCEVTFPRYPMDIKRHCETNPHDGAMEEIPVVTSIGNEFIREVRKGLFHCGYCNLVVGSWDVLNDHLDSSEHKESRREAEHRLETLRPMVARRIREMRENDLRANYIKYFYLYNSRI